MTGPHRAPSWPYTALCATAVAVLMACSAQPPTPDVEAPAQDETRPEPGARYQPGTEMGIYAPEQHDLYGGRFIIVGNAVHQVGTLNDESPWDHMGDDASTDHPNIGHIYGRLAVDTATTQEGADGSREME